MTRNPYILYNIQYWALESINPNTSKPHLHCTICTKRGSCLACDININSYHRPKTRSSDGKEPLSRSATQPLSIY